MHSITRRPQWSELRAWMVPFVQVVLVDTLGVVAVQLAYVVWAIDDFGEQGCLYVGKTFATMRERLKWHLSAGTDVATRVVASRRIDRIMLEVIEIEGALDEAEAYYMRQYRPALGSSRAAVERPMNPPTAKAERKPLPHMVPNPLYHHTGFPSDELRAALQRRHRLMHDAELRFIEFDGDVWDIGSPNQGSLLDDAA